MVTSATESPLQLVLPWRDLYRQEMSCQIIHDSIHFRAGWTREHLLRDGATTVGYGSVAVAGPWKEKPTIYEFHATPPPRGRAVEPFESLPTASGALSIENQANHPQLTVILPLLTKNVDRASNPVYDR